MKLMKMMSVKEAAVLLVLASVLVVVVASSIFVVKKQDLKRLELLYTQRENTSQAYEESYLLDSKRLEKRQELRKLRKQMIKQLRKRLGKPRPVMALKPLVPVPADPASLPIGSE